MHDKEKQGFLLFQKVDFSVDLNLVLVIFMCEFPRSYLQNNIEIASVWLYNKGKNSIFESKLN